MVDATVPRSHCRRCTGAGGTTGTTEKAVLLQLSDGPASGGLKTQQHYTNIHRMECLARSHPLVLKVEEHKPEKARDKPVLDKFGRAFKWHQSPHDLFSVGIIVGCSVNGARQGLLSLWWGPANGCQLTREQESLAQAVFFDLVEAANGVPSMYAADYNAASGASAAAAPAALASVSGGASVAAGSDSAASGCPAGSSSSSTTEARGPGAAAASTSTAAPTQLAFGGHACSAGAPAAAAADTPMTAPAVAAAMEARAAPLLPASGGHAHAAVAPSQVSCPAPAPGTKIVVDAVGARASGGVSLVTLRDVVNWAVSARRVRNELGPKVLSADGSRLRT